MKKLYKEDKPFMPKWLKAYNIVVITSIAILLLALTLIKLDSTDKHIDQLYKNQFYLESELEFQQEYMQYIHSLLGE